MRRTIFSLICAICAIVAQAITYSGTLPVMFITTEGGEPITSKENYLVGTYYLDNMGIEGIESIGSAAEPLALQIRGRGNYSWVGFDKKPYRLKLDTKQALLGMSKSKHFALMAHADDSYGFMRNIVGFQLSRMIGMPWTPADAPVEVVLNGDYIGLYFLTETVRVDENRVNIVEQADLATNPAEITGGWLVEIDNYDSDPHIEITEGDKDQNRIIFTYKTPEELSQEQIDYLTTQMTAINEAIYREDLNDNTWENYVDTDVLARNYIVQEIVDDYESFHGSCYIFKDLGENTKWKFGPVWDFGNAFSYQKQQYFYQGREWHNTWIEQICRHPHFMEIVKAVWNDFYTTKYGELDAYITNYYNRIKDAAMCDAKRWPQYGHADLNKRVNKVKERLAHSVHWLNNQWGEKNTYSFSFTDNITPAWSNVYAYMWYNDNGTTMKVLGKWPGTQLSKDDTTGNYIYSFESQALPDNTMIIFNNGGSGSGKQTDDLKFINDGIYNRDGYVGSGIIDADMTDTLSHPTTITNLAGQIIKGEIGTLSPGFYIINRKKVFIR